MLVFAGDLLNSVKVDISYDEKASRLEVIIRIAYWIVFLIIGTILGMVAVYIMWPLNMLVSLILGKRIGIFAKVIAAYVKYSSEYMAYLFGATDERPPIVPEF